MFKEMPLEVVRFAKSDLVAFAPAEAVLAALMLWGSAWHSRPAGSLTNDDRSLARAAGYGRGAEAAWAQVRDDAMRGWYEASDGRLYHPVLAEKVRESWQARLRFKHRSYLSAIRVHNSRNPNDQRAGLGLEDWLERGRPEGAKAAAAKPEEPELELGNDEMLRATDDDVTRNTMPCNALPGPEGKGTEMSGNEMSLIDSSTATNPKEIGVADVADETWDLLGITNRLARLGGVSIHREAARARAMDLVKGWIAAGIDIQKTAIPAIEEQRRETSEKSIGGLEFYAGRIAKRHADSGDEARGPPLTVEERVEAQRRTVALYRRMGRTAEADQIEQSLGAEKPPTTTKGKP
jgi:hypothetical protein